MGKIIHSPYSKIIVLISADAEWKVIHNYFSEAEIQASPYGDWFTSDLNSPECAHKVIFFHGGWGKISAAGSTQYVIDRWQPSLLINIGTCGGFANEVKHGTIILVDRTIVYDIIEQMGDNDEHIAHYTTDLNLSWLGNDFPHEVLQTLIVSADRDLIVDEIPLLKSKYGAVAGDWESAAIAFVAKRNKIPLLILRGVTDLVGRDGGEAYQNVDIFYKNTEMVMRLMINALPSWISLCKASGLSNNGHSE